MCLWVCASVWVESTDVHVIVCGCCAWLTACPLSSHNRQVGTINYMAPEALTASGAGGRLKLGRASDVWSLGCILYQMVYGAAPFAAITNVIVKMRAIVDNSHEIAFPAIQDTFLVDVMKRCLQRDPTARPTITGVTGLLNHPYLHPERLSAMLFPLLSDAARNDIVAAETETQRFVDDVRRGSSSSSTTTTTPAPVTSAEGVSGRAPAASALLAAFTTKHAAAAAAAAAAASTAPSTSSTDPTVLLPASRIPTRSAPAAVVSDDKENPRHDGRCGAGASGLRPTVGGRVPLAPAPVLPRSLADEIASKASSLKPVSEEAKRQRDEDLRRRLQAKTGIAALLDTRLHAVKTEDTTVTEGATEWLARA